MATPNARVSKIINQFLDHLQKHIDVKEVYLFGSCAQGNAGKFSDIDLAIVSHHFSKMKPFDRLVFLGKVAWEAETPIIEAIGYSPSEFVTKSPTEFPYEIKANGVPIKIKRAA